MLAVTKMLILVVGVSGMMMVDGGGLGESSCDLDNIPTMEHYDLRMTENRLYVKYLSHEPSYIRTLNIASTMLEKRLSSDEKEITVHGMDLLADGKCQKSFPSRMRLEGGKEVSYPLKDPYNNTVLITAHLLATDCKNTFLMYYNITVNGQHSKDESVIAVLVADPDLDPDMAAVEHAVVKFCGKKARDTRSFFHEMQIQRDGLKACIGDRALSDAADDW